MKRTKKQKHILIVIVFIIVIAVVVTYVLPLTVLAEETPPPVQPGGTDWGYDDSTLDIPPFDEEDEDTPLPVLKITTSGPLRLDVGQQVPIGYEMTDFPEGTLLEWSTGNPEIAAIGADGILVARSPGSTDVIARAGDMRASLLVEVNSLRAAGVVIVIGEEISKTGVNSYELKVGDVIRLTAKVEPEGAKVDKFSWMLGNDRVATLSQNGKTAELVATEVGNTQVTLVAGKLTHSITFEIIESGVGLDTLWVYIRYVVIIVIAVVVIAVVLSIMAQQRKKEKARQRAAAKRRREEAERRARREREREEEAERRAREAVEARQREIWERRHPQGDERTTMRVSGAVVGAGLAEPKNGPEEPERPLTLDDLD